MSGARPLPRVALLSGLVLFAAAVWSFHAWRTVVRPDRQRFTFDSAQYALAARSLASTGRLSTPYAYVGSLRAGSKPPFPLLAGHPLLPVLQAPVFVVLGARPWAALVPIVFAHLVVVALGTCLVLEVGGGTVLAALVGVALAGTPHFLQYATDGLSELPFTALWTGAILLLAGFGRTPRPAALGVLLGLAHLARPVVTPTLPLWIAAAAWAAAPGGRVRSAGRLVAGFAPFALALLAYKAMTTGEPFADLGGVMLLVDLAPAFDAHDVARLLHPPGALEWALAHPDALLAKLANNLPVMAGHALRLGGWALGLSFAGFALRPAGDGSGPLRLATGGSLVMLATLAALTLPRWHYLLPMLPAVMALGAVSLARLVRAARLPAPAAIAIAGLALLWSTWRPLVTQWRAEAPAGAGNAAFTEREFAGLGTMLARRLPEGALVSSDIAPWVSWYTGRPSVNLPLEVGDLAELHDRHGVSAVVLSNEWLVHRPRDAAWREVFESRRSLPGWVTASVVRSGRLRAHVLLADSSEAVAMPAARHVH